MRIRMSLDGAAGSTVITVSTHVCGRNIELTYPDLPVIKTETEFEKKKRSEKNKTNTLKTALTI